MHRQKRVLRSAQELSSGPLEYAPSVYRKAYDGSREAHYNYYLDNG